MASASAAVIEHFLTNQNAGFQQHCGVIVFGISWCYEKDLSSVCLVNLESR